MIPLTHQRRSLRLRGYDYARAGAYYITICTAARLQVFGQVLDGLMHLSHEGVVVEQEWLRTPLLRPNIELDAFIVMPNHIHMVVVIVRSAPSSSVPGALRSPSQTLGAIIRGFKSAVTKQLGWPVWQRNYYEHVVRGASDLERIRAYIALNPARWCGDTEDIHNGWQTMGPGATGAGTAGED
jgi:REP element-mobilizing transposase RayT